MVPIAKAPIEKGTVMFERLEEINCTSSPYPVLKVS